MVNKIKLKRLQAEASEALAKGDKIKAKQLRLEMLQLLKGK